MLATASRVAPDNIIHAGSVAWIDDAAPDTDAGVTG